MSETKHTPLPWKVADEYQTDDCNITYHAAIRDANNKLVLAIQQVTFDAEEQMQAIRQIVTSVNARPKVEELLEMIFSKERQFHAAEWGKGKHYDWPPVVDKAREVEAALKVSA
jgi:hypothetical protein